MLSRFHSAVVRVADLAAAVNHYAALFGRPPAIRARTGEGVDVALFRLTNTMLELRASDQSDGLTSIRLAATKLDDARERLAARGVECLPNREAWLVSQDGSAGAAGDEAMTSYRSLRVDAASSRGIALDLIEAGESSATSVGSDSLDDAAGIRALDHVVVFSAAIERTRAFYEEDLGIRLALDKTFEKRGVRLIFFRIGGTTIEIGGRLDVPEEASGEDRFGGLAWQVVDIDAIQARLRVEGFDVSEIRDGNKPGTRVCTVRDRTHGVPTLLIQPVSR